MQTLLQNQDQSDNSSTIKSIHSLASMDRQYTSHRHRRCRDNSSSSSSSSSNSVTLWLMVLSILVIIGIITIGFVLIYIVVNSGITVGSSTASETRLLDDHNNRPENTPVVIELLQKPSSSVPPSTSSSLQNVGKQQRSKRSPLLSSSSTFVEGSSDPINFYRRYDVAYDMPKAECIRRSLPMCNGQVPYNSTVYPNYIGDNNELEASRSLPYYNYIAKSKCNRRIKQLLCTFLEPPCVEGRPIPPCKKFCRIALEGCAEYVPATLELSAAFDCRRYPDSTDPSVCVNLAIGKGCAADEFQCPDKSCIPKHWLCDGVRDCAFAADEANCAGVACSSEEFECDRKCVPLSWRCDGDRDCMDGADEANCSYKPGCGPDRFKCADGAGCIPKRWVCDGKAECRDGSDEVGCTQKECTQGDFKCNNGICIPNIWLCDGQDDCKDNSDERNCGGQGPVISSHFPQYTSSSVSSSTSSSSSSSSSSPGESTQNHNDLNHNHNHQQRPHVQHQSHQQQQQQHQQQSINHRPNLHSIGPYFSHNNIYRWLHK
ncbi:atrial natriuretic peptide-converting enzyme-like [Panonychus citri]|uniref:atrial natriuretic peptide-converting enzyme-like n=1 Tax=Panonychus citri TaxID=50023 RepID=UPI0023074345|nr:atrial natriuretic peptide-converting enzyme-like [Panonychus citri]